MATKKQKRAAGLAKHEQEMADLKARGLAAQAAGRRSQDEERKRLSAMAQRVNVRHKEIIDRTATAAQKLQIEQERAAATRLNETLDELVVESRKKTALTGRVDSDPVLNELVMFNRGMRI